MVDLGDAVAVVADKYWRAKTALDALTVEFDGGTNSGVTTDSIFASYSDELAVNDGDSHFESGDAKGVIADASEVIGIRLSSAVSRPFLHGTHELHGLG